MRHLTAVLAIVAVACGGPAEPVAQVAEPPAVLPTPSLVERGEQPAASPVPSLSLTQTPVVPFSFITPGRSIRVTGLGAGTFRARLFLQSCGIMELGETEGVEVNGAVEFHFLAHSLQDSASLVTIARVQDGAELCGEQDEVWQVMSYGLEDGHDYPAEPADGWLRCFDEP